MKNQNNEYNNFEQLLPNWLKDSKFLLDFLSGYEYLIENYINPSISQLKTCNSIRDKNAGYSTYKDILLLQRKAYELGLRITTSNYSLKQLGRILENYQEYCKTITSKDQLANFIGDILGMSLSFKQLWSQGTTDDHQYNNLTPSDEVLEDQKITIFKDVQAPLEFFFPTSNYDIYIDNIIVQTQDQIFIQEIIEKIKDLFQQLSPINYVLQDISSRIVSNTMIVYTGTQSWEKIEIPSDNLVIDTEAGYYTADEIDALFSKYISYYNIEDSSFDRNAANKVQLKNEVIEISLISDNLLSKDIQYNLPDSKKIVTELAFATGVDNCFTDNYILRPSSEGYSEWKSSILEEI